MKIRCIVVDDEPIARKGIEKYVKQVDFLDLVATCSSALELNNMLSKSKVDLVFLDIQMPGVTGLDYLRSLKDPPLVIITTAFRQYAVEGYELNLIDYLLKPITNVRFLKAVNKAKDYFALLHVTDPDQDKNYFFIKCDKKLEKISTTDITYIESMQNYIVVHSNGKKHTTLLTLKKIKEFLPDSSFIQVHNSYIVSIAKIDSIEANLVVIGDHKIPISRKLKEHVLTQVVNARLLKNKRSS